MLMLILSAHASEVEFTPEVQVRPRFEFRSLDRDVAAAHAISQRSRLGVTAERGDLAARVVVQDVRLWGEEGNTLKDFAGDNIDVHTATLTWAASSTTSLTVGRQDIALHEHRLIGTVDWTQQGRAFDGLRFQWTDEDLHADLSGVVLAEGDSATYGTPDTALMGIARVGWKSVDVVYIPEIDWATDTWRHTGGLYAAGKSGIMSGRIEAYGQMTTDLEPAGMVGVRGGIAPEVGGKPTITLWWDSLSPRFNTLYDTRHKFYGLADVAVFQLGGATTGLHDGALKLGISPGDVASVKLDTHVFMAADGTGLIGEEVDLTVGTKLPGGLGFAVGGAAFMYADGTTPAQMWGWAQLNAKL
ncbi:MAG: alginate export family protein [Proteobacteria bacterium]|nr:alginate export family protein [Pseudomonadota bacterium]MCP4916050.1 alginate export family protein [Pseudomonadota bacterium]